MRMLLRFTLTAMLGAGLILAQHGGGGGHSGGGGGGGFHGGGGFSGGSSFHSSSGASSRMSYSGSSARSNIDGYNINVQPGARSYYSYYPSYRPHPPIAGPGRNYGSYGYGSPYRRYGYYGVGLYPVFPLGYGYYDNSYDDSGYYAPGPDYYQQQPDYQPEYQPYMNEPQMAPMPGPDPGYYYGGGYPPIPYQMQQQPPAPGSEQAPEPPSSPITVVLKNGQRIQVRSYAITNGMFWDFSTPTTKRIPVGEIDLPASVKATEAAGGVFPAESFAANPN